VALIVSQAQTTNKLFEDVTFPSNEKSLYDKTMPAYLKDIEVVWKRPHEISKSPEMIKNGISPGDVISGLLEDSWLLGSFLVVKPELLGSLCVRDEIKSGLVVF
jgi:hypothetical protein